MTPSRLAGPRMLAVGCALAVLSVLGVSAFAVAHAPAGGARWAAFGLAAAALAALGGAMWLAYAGGLRPMARASVGAQRLTQGDLSQAIASGDGADALAHALDEMREQTFRIVSDVRSRTLSIATSSGHIAADQAGFASAVRAQADALESTASALEQMTAAVEHNADNAARGHEVATSTHDIASKGGHVVQEVVTTMGAIRNSSGKIVEIISVIDGIAFQTNILALNAAVEAARAGEHGRGFAVVASEVRALANRSAEAAKAVKKLIEESVTAVETGASLVDRAGETMQRIVGGVQRVTDIMSDMSAATRQQSAGIAEINRAMAEIDAATQKNAAIVDRAGEPVKALHGQAIGLTEAVSFFKLGEREFATVDEAAELVRKAAKFVQSHGAAALVADVKRLDQGQFIDRDLYLCLYDLNAQCMAHGVNARLVGVDGRNFKDIDGKAFVAEIIAAAKSSGSGTIKYRWLHPLTQKALEKTTYFERHGGLVLSCGAYSQAD
ncbi:MAG: methyl-accepting chemotaxis protein [Rhizobacter sp.]